ncbi:hypothetical protein vseg_006539 [Gypsophila vaccaria]
MARQFPPACNIDDRSLMSDLPHVIKACEIIEQTKQGLYPSPACLHPEYEQQTKQGLYPSPAFLHPEYERGKCLGLYEKPSDLEGQNSKSWLAKKMACVVSSSLVGVECYRGPDDLLWKGSGIIFNYCGVNKILTAGYILGDRVGGEVDLLLPNQKKSKGLIICVNAHYNIAIIEANLDEFRGVQFSSSLMALGQEVTALGRDNQFQLVGSVGKVEVRRDHFESDVLMCSTCNVSKWGIGGPLVDSSTGEVCGINFFSKKGCTPFLPSKILHKCIEHILGRGGVVFPWIGWKIRCLDELKLDELEAIYSKYNTFDGVIVKEVMKNSPADMAGICPGDIIHKCNGHDINSPVELADLLFEDVDSRRKKMSRQPKKRATTAALVSVTSGSHVKSLIIRRFSPLVDDSWPILRSD